MSRQTEEQGPVAGSRLRGRKRPLDSCASVAGKSGQPLSHLGPCLLPQSCAASLKLGVREEALQTQIPRNKPAPGQGVVAPGNLGSQSISQQGRSWAGSESM